MHIIPAAVMTSQEPQSSSDTSGATMQVIENQGQLYQQQPTYVLLQTTGEQDGSGQPQVFLAMQTGGVTGQDSQVIASNLAFQLLLCSRQFHLFLLPSSQYDCMATVAIFLGAYFFSKIKCW